MEFDAARGVLPAGFTFSRGGTATYFDRTGALQEAAANAPRFNYDPVTLAFKGLLVEEPRTNSIPNPRAEGASAGAPGTIATGWGAYFSGGLSLQCTGVGTEYGMRYTDLRFYGTSTATSENTIYFNNAVAIAAAQNQIWTGSVYARQSAGTTNNMAVNLRLFELNSVGAYLGESGVAMTPTLGTFQRYVATRTLSNATAAQVSVQISVFASGIGVAVDFTIRVYHPQLEQGAFATSPILPPAGTPGASSRAADDVNCPTGGWFNPSEGTIIAEGDFYSLRDGNYYSRLWALRSSNSDYITSSANYGFSAMNVTVSGVSQAALPHYVTPSYYPASVKTGAAWRQNDFSFARGGGSLLTSGAGTIPTVNVLYLGKCETGDAWYLGGHIRRFAYYPKRLTNAQLLALTQ